MKKFLFIVLTIGLLSSAAFAAEASKAKAKPKAPKPPTAAQIAKAKKAYLENLKKGLSLKEFKLFAGKSSVTGVIRFPKPVPAGNLVHINIQGKYPGKGGNYMAMVAYTDGSNSVKFKLIDLAEGEYHLEAKVDANGDQKYTDDDPQGYYNDGKPEPFYPILEKPFEQPIVKVGAKPVTGILIVLGIKPPRAAVAPTAVPTPAQAPTAEPTAVPAPEAVATEVPKAEAPAMAPEAQATAVP